MEQNIEDVDLLIVRYLDNEATSDEKTMLDVWINESQDNRRYFAHMVRTWEHSHISLQDEQYVTERFSHFSGLLFKRKIRRVIYGISTAAAVALLLLMIHFIIPSSDGILLSEVTDNQKKEVVLPDGSIVWLNKNSQIQYPEDFKLQRRVHLTGEAYFDVIKNEKLPFIVETVDFSIEVLGTRFVVTDYNEGSVSETVLESGMIKLTAQKTGEELILQPGQMVTHDRVMGETHLQSVDAHHFTDWIKDSLIFENASLKDVFTQLEKWYGIKIVCRDGSILQVPVSFSIDAETKEEILNTLQVVVPFRWKEEPNHGEILSVITILPAK